MMTLFLDTCSRVASSSAFKSSIGSLLSFRFIRNKFRASKGRREEDFQGKTGTSRSHVAAGYGFVRDGRLACDAIGWQLESLDQRESSSEDELFLAAQLFSSPGRREGSDGGAICRRREWPPEARSLI